VEGFLVLCGACSATPKGSHCLAIAWPGLIAKTMPVKLNCYWPTTVKAPYKIQVAAHISSKIKIFLLSI